MEALVTIIVPVYNVQNYLEKCLDSICGQTYKKLEILCVDDGSTDFSGKILDQYAQRDKRIVVIHKANAGYGQTMNIGMKYAHGKYMQIVESDDYIKPNMTQELLSVIEQYKLDFVKSDFWRFFQENELQYYKICTNDEHYNKIICAQNDLTVFDDNLYHYTGIYNMEFIRENSIQFNESPGASYQDNGFWFQTIALAKRIMFIDKAFYCIRRNNPNSSYYCTDKIYAMGLEFDYIKSVIIEKLNRKKEYLHIHNKYRIVGYIFTAQRLDIKYVDKFHKFVKEQIDREYKEGNIDESILSLHFKEIMECIKRNDDNWVYLVRYNMPKSLVLKLNEAKSTIIYGAGVVGTRFFHQLKKFSWDVTGFAVSDMYAVEYEKEGIPVKPIYEWLKKKDDYLIIVAAGKKNREEIEENLRRLAISNYLCI